MQIIRSENEGVIERKAVRGGMAVTAALFSDITLEKNAQIANDAAINSLKNYPSWAAFLLVLCLVGVANLSMLSSD
jgi:hypothetical protein